MFQSARELFCSKRSGSAEKINSYFAHYSVYYRIAATNFFHLTAQPAHDQQNTLSRHGMISPKPLGIE